MLKTCCSISKRYSSSVDGGFGISIFDSTEAVSLFGFLVLAVTAVISSPSKGVNGGDNTSIFSSAVVISSGVFTWFLVFSRFILPVQRC